MPIPSQIAADVAENPLAFPGLYQRYAVTDDGSALCPECCKTEASVIAESTPRDGWYVVADDINFEDEIWCSHCASRIPASYDED